MKVTCKLFRELAYLAADMRRKYGDGPADMVLHVMGELEAHAAGDERLNARASEAFWEREFARQDENRRREGNRQ